MRSRYSALALGAGLAVFALSAQAQVLGDLSCIEDATKCPDMATLVYAFSTVTGTNGFTPAAALTLGNDGNLYGTTQHGGNVNSSNQGGYGTVFRMTPGGAITTLHAFDFYTDGAGPDSPLVKGPDGSMWGITASPAAVFKVAPDGTFTSFGLMPYWAGEADNGLAFGLDGNLYGTMIYQSANAPDTFFQFTPSGVATLLYTFKFHPGPVVSGNDGYFYGTVTAGASTGLYRLSMSGGYTLISTPGVQFGTTPGLVLGSDGYFYGVTTYPGIILSRIDPSGNITSLANLSNSYLNGTPAALTQGSDGNFYGATSTVFSISPNGAFTTLYPLQAHNTNLQGGINFTQLTFGPGGLYGVVTNGGPGCQNAAPIACSVYTSGGIFRLSAASAAGSPGAGGPPALTSALDAIDPNNDTLRPFLPLPSLGIEWDNSFYPQFASYALNTTALAADGVTPLVLRWHFSTQPPGDVTFTLSDSTCAGAGETCENSGTFLCLDPFNCELDPNNLLSITTSPVALADGSYEAFAMMQSPIDFVRPSTQAADSVAMNRTITVTATTPAASGPPIQQTLPLTLWRPPVALLHGIWSNACTWNKLGLKFDPLSRFIVFAQDYEPTNSYHFAVNAAQPQMAIASALARMHGLDIAATQVDFIGHSMGGLLARLYAVNYFPQTQYVRPDNLGLGDIHKLITLDTPHLGSELANALVDASNNETTVGTIFENAIELFTSPATACIGPTLPSTLAPVMCITCGAVQDLRQGSIPLTGMPVVNVPAHVIVGRGGAAALVDPSDFGAFVAPLGGTAPAFAAAVAGLAFQYTYFGADSHDLIVSATSQEGNMFVPDQITYLDAVDLQDWAVHITVTSEVQTNTVLVNLLNAQLTNTDIFGALPSTP
jgi:uncharacterized repeat protein (TIGR03803 family)